jgi:hypothetical protein
MTGLDLCTLTAASTLTRHPEALAPFARASKDARPRPGHSACGAAEQHPSRLASRAPQDDES